MDQIGLLNSLLDAVINIDNGRKGFAADGKEHEGRLSYEEGISTALASFKEAEKTGDCRTLILAEQAFLERELHFCHAADTITRSSLTAGIRDFEDGLRCLKTVESKPLYQAAETTYSTTKYRIQGFPKDIFHQASGSHYTRLSNSLRTPGINMIEKAVIQQRMLNMKAAINCYIAKQKMALAISS
ncbi:hypothetical protein ACYULU_09285 [Breznakiellaceae bacterium SP9]